jgi:eukaryotic-like serine/threonine-protein kinase
MNWSLAPGDVLAHYRVVSPLGSGGMGQVYLAEDVRLGRKLALKVLSPRALRDPERLRRFEREARTISSLNHPNILTIYDIGDADGVQFIATEYIDGLTLRAVLQGGRLDVRRALDIAGQVGQALAAAHAAGVIHRDVKPENVMVRADGYVKVLDFGLVKLAGADSSPDATARTELVDTKEGLVMGSVSYMAPEQARGRDIDARVDLFAFGIVLYEMLAGEPPFKGASVADVLGALLFKEPEPLIRVAPIPVQLDRIVATALRKDRDQRYQTVAHLLADLRAVIRTMDMHGESGGAETPGSGLDQTSDGFAGATLKGLRRSGPAHDDSGAAPSPPRRRRGAKRVIDSLAVLPLMNQSQDQELDYLSDGLTESLINNLSQIPRLRVMARSTVFRYKGQNPDPRVVGRQLDVKAVLTGHLRQRGSDFIVGAELVDVDDGAQLWGTLLNRRPSDVFVLQAEISRELTDALRLRLTRDEKSRLVKPHTVNAAAYQAYLRGRYFLNQRTVDALRESRQLFERAVAEDPQYALAYAGLADCCSLLAVSYRTPSLSGLIEQARTAAQTALAIDEGLAEGHASLAFIKFRFDWDWQGAESAFTRALDLNPGHAPSRQWHAMFLASRGRFEAALGEMRRAQQLDLLSLIIQTGIGRILHFAGRYDEALLQYEHVLQTNPGFAQMRIDLALTRIARAEYEIAREELDLAEGLFGSVSTIVLLKGICAVRQGRMDEGQEAFEALEERYARGTAGPDDLALLAAVLGEWPLARHWLNEACTQRAPFLGYVDVEPAMAPLHEDPACRALLRRYGFGLP